MTSKGKTLSKHILRASAVLVVAMGASACSTVPDWVDPTTWVGDDSTPTATAPADQGAQTADNAQTPDLSTIPDRPQTPSTSDEQRDVAQSLASDRSKAQYSADALRGGTEPSAAPPPAEAGPATEDVASNDNAAAPAPEPAKPAGPPPAPAAGPGTLPAEAAASSDNAAPQAAPAPAAAPTQAVAATTMSAPAGEPAVPAIEAAPAPAGPGMPSVSANVPNYPSTDAALGFKPSSAPPLDATVAQFVPPSILARYRETAAIGPGPAVPVDSGYASTDTSSKKHRARHTAMGQGGPEKMSGAVVANFESLQAVEPASGLPGGPQAVVYFPHDTTVLDAQAKAQVRASAQAFLAQGGQGYVRVIGHSSSDASSMKAERSMVWNFERSQARANAVARLLIQEGVPAAKVLVQAAGNEEAQDSDGNRRAEIFFQS
ncbi:MAG TPA: OmpA family protein [Rhizomicrobium sp.]|nr:OmpA family protein [Rhizomicrobium sp.]